MTRVIADLRKALGDAAREARYIETVPTKGYRFIAEVRKAADAAGLSERRPAAVRFSAPVGCRAASCGSPRAPWASSSSSSDSGRSRHPESRRRPRGRAGGSAPGHRLPRPRSVPDLLPGRRADRLLLRQGRRLRDLREAARRRRPRDPDHVGRPGQPPARVVARRSRDRVRLTGPAGHLARAGPRRHAAPADRVRVAARVVAGRHDHRLSVGRPVGRLGLRRRGGARLVAVPRPGGGRHARAADPSRLARGRPRCADVLAGRKDDRLRDLDGNETGRIWSVSRLDGSLQRVSSSKGKRPRLGWCFDPVYSPRGDWIYFAATSGATWLNASLWTARAPSAAGEPWGEPEPVTSGGSASLRQIAVSPDGSSLAYDALVEREQPLVAARSTFVRRLRPAEPRPPDAGHRVPQQRARVFPRRFAHRLHVVPRRLGSRTSG